MMRPISAFMDQSGFKEEQRVRIWSNKVTQNWVGHPMYFHLERGWIAQDGGMFTQPLYPWVCSPCGDLLWGTSQPIPSNTL